MLARCSLMWIALAYVVVAASVSHACNVPVFRYALERWPVDPYEVYIFHEGPLSEADLTAIESFEQRLDAFEFQSQPYFIETVDITEEMPRHIKSFHRAAKPTQYPWMLVQYPKSLPSEAPAHTGPFDKQVLESIFDSPLRQEIAGHILKGESVVWLLIKCGDKEKDGTALRMLHEELAALKEELKLPELTADDDRYIDIDAGPKLRLSFTLLAVSRDDPKEKHFLQVLENWDRSVIAEGEPVAFSFFGRSRVLPAFSGKNLNPQALYDACQYLIGPCGCQIKRDNPGYDVLTTVNWDGVITGQYTLAEALPRLTTVSASNVVPLDQAIVLPAANPSAAPPSAGTASPMQSMLLTLGGAILIVVIITVVMQSRRSEE